jgi:DNA-binding transcriptional ArsR family regulator
MEDRDFVRIFKALADKTRQDILELLGEDERNVSDICSVFKTSQPTISHHLQILKNSNLVDSRKEGKNIYYFVRQETFRDAFGGIVRKMRIRVVKKH